MKKLFGWILPALALVVSGCASGPDTGPVLDGVEVVAPNFVIVDHKNAAFGKDAPQWVTMEQSELEKLDEFKDLYVFRFEETGRDLDGVKFWANGFTAQTEVARIVNTRVQEKLVGAAAGDKDMLETYLESVAKVMAQSQFSGYRRYSDYWVLKRYLRDDGSKDREEYLYILLYTMPKRSLDDYVRRSFETAGESAQPGTEEEKTARERVKDAFENGI